MTEGMHESRIRESRTLIEVYVYDFAWPGPDDKPALRDPAGRCIEAAVKRMAQGGDPYDPEQAEHLGTYLTVDDVRPVYRHADIIITHDNRIVSGRDAVTYLRELAT